MNDEVMPILRAGTSCRICPLQKTEIHLITQATEAGDTDEVARLQVLSDNAMCKEDVPRCRGIR